MAEGQSNKTTVVILVVIVIIAIALALVRSRPRQAAFSPAHQEWIDMPWEEKEAQLRKEYEELDYTPEMIEHELQIWRESELGITPDIELDEEPEDF